MISDERSSVLEALSAECARQDQKWGTQDHDDPLWYLILGEEFGEVGKAILELRGPAEVEKEVVQVAAVAVQWLEAMRRRRPDRDRDA